MVAGPSSLGVCAMAHPDFGRSVNPISTRGDRLCPPNYYWHTRIFWPSDGPGWDRVKISENLGATSIAPVTPVDTSLQYSTVSYSLKIHVRQMLGCLTIDYAPVALVLASLRYRKSLNRHNVWKKSNRMQYIIWIVQFLIIINVSRYFQRNWQRSSFAFYQWL